MRNSLNPQKIKSLFEGAFDPAKPKWVYLCIIALIITGVFSAYLQGKQNKVGEPVSLELEESADTYIPNGYVLVPLDISNGLSISNLMGRYTFVDIYTTNSLDERQKKIIAQNLRMLKAPHDDNQFAVLVGENEYKLIHDLSEPVFIVIKNPNTKKHELISKEKDKKAIRTSRISYGN